MPADEDIKKQEDGNPYSRSKKKAKSKKPFIIAAAAALLAAIAIIVGINIFNEKPLYIPPDNEYQGDWQYGKPILKEDLKDFKGDIKITLDINVLQKDPMIAPEMYVADFNEKPINIQAYNIGRTVSDSYFLFEGQTKFAFVITREELDKASRQIQMRCYNLFVKGATIENYDPKEDEISPNAKIIQLDSEYRGAWQRSSPIPKEELEAFNGDVRVTLTIEAVKVDKEPNDSEPAEYWVHLAARRNANDDPAYIKPDYLAPMSWSEYKDVYWLGENAVPDKFTFVITTEEIEKLDSDTGLVFSARNLIAKSAVLEKA